MAATGFVYTLHLRRPLAHAAHYTGWARDLDRRLDHHRNGTGARMLQVARERGIDWTVVTVEPGDKKRERQLKKQGGASRRCPICKRTGG